MNFEKQKTVKYKVKNNNIKIEIPAGEYSVEQLETWAALAGQILKNKFINDSVVIEYPIPEQID